MIHQHQFYPILKPKWRKCNRATRSQWHFGSGSTCLRLPSATPRCSDPPGIAGARKLSQILHGSLNVPIFHITQPLDSIRYMVYNGYYKVMSNIPKMGHLTTPVLPAKKTKRKTTHASHLKQPFAET